MKGNFYYLSLNGKNTISQGFEGEFLLFVLNGKNTPILSFWPQMLSLTLEFSQKTMFLNKFLNIPSILNLSLPLFLG